MIDQSQMWVCNSSQIFGSRSIVQFFQHRVGTRIRVSLCDFGFLVVQVTELDRLSWTCVLASGSDFVRSDLAIAFCFRLDLCVLNSLHAVSTLFHHAAAANGNFRVHHQVLQVTIAVRKLVSTRVCLLYTSPSPRDRTRSRMPSSA